MTKVNLINKIEELKKKYLEYTNQLELCILEKCPYIVQVGALTISTNVEGEIIIHNTDYPTLFTQKAVDEILTLTYRKGDGNIIIPKVYSRNEWYRERLHEITRTLCLLESVAQQ
jgi:hypothetical protein